MRQALDAAGAADIWDEDDDTSHLNGTARMGDDPRASVVNVDCRSWTFPICGFATAWFSQRSATSIHR
jgi:choline dehydrogenase-like flavoprotein